MSKFLNILLLLALFGQTAFGQDAFGYRLNDQSKNIYFVATTKEMPKLIIKDSENHYFAFFDHKTLDTEFDNPIDGEQSFLLDDGSLYLNLLLKTNLTVIKKTWKPNWYSGNWQKSIRDSQFRNRIFHEIEFVSKPDFFLIALIQGGFYNQIYVQWDNGVRPLKFKNPYAFYKILIPVYFLQNPNEYLYNDEE